MIRLNLIPDVKLEYLKINRTHKRVIGIASIVTIGTVSLVVLLAMWVYGGQALHKGYLTTQIENNEKKLKAVPEIEKYLTLQNQLANLTTLHEGKSDFSRLLQYLPVLTPAAPHDVKFNQIEVTSDDELGNTLIFQGETKDYTGLATFRDTLTNAQLKADEGVDEKLFESVTVVTSTISQSAKGGSVVVFRVETVYNPNAFIASVKNPTVTVPSKNTTQSVQASPDVFRESSVEGGQ